MHMFKVVACLHMITDKQSCMSYHSSDRYQTYNSEYNHDPGNINDQYHFDDRYEGYNNNHTYQHQELYETHSSSNDTDYHQPLYCQCDQDHDYINQSVHDKYDYDNINYGHDYETDNDNDNFDYDDYNYYDVDDNNYCCQCYDDYYSF